MLALVAGVYFIVLGIFSWNDLPVHWMAFLFIGLAILALHFALGERLSTQLNNRRPQV